MIERLFVMICALLSLIGLGGCTETTNVIAEPPGRLVGIQYERKNPTVYGDDFFFSVSTEEIIELYVYLDEPYELYEYVTLTNIPIDSACWNTVEELVLGIYPELREGVSTARESENDLFVLDGGDESSFVLVWDCDAGEQAIVYHVPASDEVVELVQLINECAEPAIRDYLQQEVIP